MKYIIFTTIIFFCDAMAGELFMAMLFYERWERKTTVRAMRIVTATAFFQVWGWLSGGSLYVQLAGAILFFSFYTVLFFKTDWIQGLCFTVPIASFVFGMEMIALFGCLPLFPEEMREQAFFPVELCAKGMMLLLTIAAKHIWRKKKWESVDSQKSFQPSVVLFHCACADGIMCGTDSEEK